MAPSICVIANVGQRDLHEAGKPLAKDRLREEGERIGQEYGKLRGQLSAPILEAAIRQVLVQHGGARVNSVILVSTDQEDERYRRGDTVTCAEVLKCLLKDTFGKSVEREPTVIRITEPPNHYDRMLTFYTRRVVVKTEAQADAVYVLCAGGTPACNTALLLAAIERFRQRCHVMTVDEKSGVAIPLAAGRRILDTYRRETLTRLLERFDFDAVALDEGHPQHVRAVAEAAAARLNFDFEGSHRVLGTLLPGLANLPREMDDLFAQTARLARGDTASAVRDLYWSASAKWCRNECADFLGRVWRLTEAALETTVGDYAGLTFDGTKASDHAFEKWAQAEAGLLDHLNKQDLSPRPTTQGLKATLKYLLGEGRFPSETADRHRRLLDAVAALDKMRGLRNKSIVAHGFKGLSKEMVLNALGLDETTMMDCLRTLVEARGVEVGENPFEQYAAAIKRLDTTGR